MYVFRQGVKTGKKCTINSSKGRDLCWRHKKYHNKINQNQNRFHCPVCTQFFTQNNEGMCHMKKEHWKYSTKEELDKILWQVALSSFLAGRNSVLKSSSD